MAGTFDNLVTVLGRDAAEKLVAAYGGVRIYVPVRAAPESAFATLIGHAAAEALSRHYGGERFDVPIAKRAPRVLRGEICRLRHEGMHVTAIARALGCTRRYVFRILADTSEAESTRRSAAEPTYGVCQEAATESARRGQKTAQRTERAIQKETDT